MPRDLLDYVSFVPTLTDPVPILSNNNGGGRGRGRGRGRLPNGSGRGTGRGLSHNNTLSRDSVISHISNTQFDDVLTKINKTDMDLDNYNNVENDAEKEKRVDENDDDMDSTVGNQDENFIFNEGGGEDQSDNLGPNDFKDNLNSSGNAAITFGAYPITDLTILAVIDPSLPVTSPSVEVDRIHPLFGLWLGTFDVRAANGEIKRDSSF